MPYCTFHLLGFGERLIAPVFLGVVYWQVKRPQAKTFFAKAIADMYAEVAGKEQSQVPRSNL